MVTITTDRGTVRAVLGPTNTGKTHLAIERMLGHPSGMIGFPLRLLARENYDRIVKLKGATTVALITGEEKIIPPNPRWWVCTVESMPLDRAVDFLAIDEIQLCGDPDRGHIFTDRLLSARGLSETMFLGSDVIAELIRQLVPDVIIENRPRFSTLRHAGSAKVTRLPKRSAIVAFSVSEVYEIAELVRSQRGGTAVVLGALSPRTRNAQVAMYQAGEVDYLVATDAIGMGLNMDVDHVAFARLSKFDGHRLRPLDAPEIGQIAGRAGRHVNDGTFGVTNNQRLISDEIVSAVETHHYQPMTKLYWRNRKLDFRSPKALLGSLHRNPEQEQLIRMRDGEDHRALAALSRDERVLERATTRDRVMLLWDICQVPDFRQMSPDHHAELLGQLFVKLIDGDGRLPEDWMAGQLKRLDRVDGEIDTITNRIAHIRTLSYLSHCNQWLPNATGWQEKTRQIEERLSDALHERLIHRFVDKRTSILTRRGEAGASSLLAGIRKNGEVVVEGHVIGRINGFQFVPKDAANARESQALIATAERVLRDHAERTVSEFEGAQDATIALGPDRTIQWDGRNVARLTRGTEPLKPVIQPLFGFVSDTAQRKRIETRLKGWMEDHVKRRFGPLLDLQRAELTGAAKGLAFHLFEGLGTCHQADARQQITTIEADDRKTLARFGVRFGYDVIYINRLLKPGPVRSRATFMAVWNGHPMLDVKFNPILNLDGLQDLAPAGSPYWTAIGYGRTGPVAIRVDRLESIRAEIRKRGKKGPFTVDGALAEMLGTPTPEVRSKILHALGCVSAKPAAGKDAEADQTLFRLKPRRKKAAPSHKKASQPKKAQRKTSKQPVARKNSDSPFAALQALLPAP